MGMRFNELVQRCIWVSEASGVKQVNEQCKQMNRQAIYPLLMSGFFDFLNHSAKLVWMLLMIYNFIDFFLNIRNLSLKKTWDGWKDGQMDGQMDEENREDLS